MSTPQCFTSDMEISNKLILPSIIDNGMVLQRGKPVRIWGQAAPHSPVTLEFLSKTYRTLSDELGVWEIVLPPQDAGGPFVMRINDTILQDILIGEVWLCSGQSNIELPLQRVMNWPDELPRDDGQAFVRQFTVPCSYNFHGPCNDVSDGRWVKADTDKLAEFSAAGYYFAIELYQRYKVPVGLLTNAAGGTPVQAWIDAEALRAFPEYREEYERCGDDAYLTGTLTQEANDREAWFSDLDRRDTVLNAQSNDYSPWNDFYVPGKWKETEIGDICGAVWFRKSFIIDKKHAGQRARLRMGCMVDSDEIFINGISVGKTEYQYPPRRYEIQEGILKVGKNVMTIRMVSPEGNGGFVKGKTYRLEFSDMCLDLSGRYSYHIGAVSPPLPHPTFFNYKPGGLYNALVAPLEKYEITGILWYQGESNTGAPDNYETLFDTLIASWRRHRNAPKLPFIFVQLANFGIPSPVMQESGWAVVRDAQRRALRISDTGMAVAVDIGEWNDLHPLDKYTLGKRLVCLARKIAYHEDTICSGPLCTSCKIEKDSLRIFFSETGSGLCSLDGRPLHHFAICGDDGIWYRATAQIEGNTVVVKSTAVSRPFSVRYAWADSPEGANLGNKEGFPASPFQIP